MGSHTCDNLFSYADSWGPQRVFTDKNTVKVDKKQMMFHHKHTAVGQSCLMVSFISHSTHSLGHPSFMLCVLFTCMYLIWYFSRTSIATFAQARIVTRVVPTGGAVLTRAVETVIPLVTFCSNPLCDSQHNENNDNKWKKYIEAFVK